MTFPQNIEAFMRLPSREQARLLYELLHVSDLSRFYAFDDVCAEFYKVAHDLAEEEGFEGDDLAARYLDRPPVDARYSGGMA